jgi:hypothetical protein
VALTLGTRLGPYEILAAIGAGGMGEVYRARDTKLNRDVAIKVLPDSFANDGERLARFTREAQTLASLNHPNIAHIHGLEESNGVRALVMELVEGEDLSQRIARGPIPIDEALPIATIATVLIVAFLSATPARAQIKMAAQALTPEQIATSESLAAKFDQAAAREQARLKTFANRPLGGAIQRSFNVFSNYLVVAAEMMPESAYAFRPTPDVRNFGGSWRQSRPLGVRRAGSSRPSARTRSCTATCTLPKTTEPSPPTSA